MRARPWAALSGPASNRAGFVALTAVGVALAAPFLLFRFLPLVDLPLHQLELAIAHGRSVDGTPFDDHYALASPWLPYWTSVWLAQAFVPVFGLATASRLPVALYAGTLPLLVGALCAVTRRSPWFAILIVPFVYENNLASGFVAYCLGVTLFVASIAWTLHIEMGPSLRRLVVLAGLGVALGFTHPQMIPPAVGALIGIIVLGQSPRKWPIAIAASTSTIPLLVWARQPSAARFQSAQGLLFLPPSGTTLGLARTLDVYPDDTEAAFFALLIVVLVLAWLASERKGQWREHRVLLVALGALASAYVLPLAWNGQLISLRLLLPALVLLPATTPPDLHPGRGLRIALAGIALFGTVQLATTVHGFNREVSRELDPLIRASAAAPRVAQLAYDPFVSWVKPPALLHAGAWLVFERGGVYGYSFDALTSRHTARVPSEQRMTDHVFDPSRELAAGRLFRVREDQFAFWNTWLVRWTAAGPVPAPAFSSQSRWLTRREGSYTLYQRQ